MEPRMKVGLISSAYPPDLDGIGDYTWWMAKTLVEQSEIAPPVTVFTRIGMDHRKTPGVEVARFFNPEYPETFSALRETLECDFANPNERLDWLVLQYNPFSYGPRGFCPRVPATLRRIRARTQRPKIAVMFHETKVHPSRWAVAVMFLWQHPIFRAVCRAADVAFVSAEHWIHQVRGAAPDLPVHHLPVGSNIPLRDIPRDQARLKAGIEKDEFVLGLFGGAHVSRRLDWIATTAGEVTRRHAGRRIALLYIGPDGSAIRSAFSNVKLIDCGALPAEEVGVRLRAMDAAISPFIDGVSTRRGSVVALLQHGIPVATTQTPWTDSVFRTSAPSGLLMSSATSAEAFAAKTADWLDRLPPGGVPDPEVSKFHDRFFRWQDIGATMLQHLRTQGVSCAPGASEHEHE